MQIADVVFALLGAWLFALLFRARDVMVIAKKDNQRTADERRKVGGGLLRMLLIEFCFLVPASTALVLLAAPFFAHLLARTTTFATILEQSPDVRRGFYVILGIASYNFPFVAVREMATRIALNTLREFYLVQHKQDTSVDGTEGEEKAKRPDSR